MKRQIEKLNKRHKAMIEWLIAHPSAFQNELAEEFKIDKSQASIIYNSEVFQKELDRRLKEQWADARKIAQDTMITLARSGDRQAAAYILDSNGYAAKQEIELNNKVIQIGLEDD